MICLDSMSKQIKVYKEHLSFYENTIACDRGLLNSENLANWSYANSANSIHRISFSSIASVTSPNSLEYFSISSVEILVSLNFSVISALRSSNFSICFSSRLNSFCWSRFKPRSSLRLKSGFFFFFFGIIGRSDSPIF